MTKTHAIDLSLPFPQLELAISFYAAAREYPRASFEQITNRQLPRGFGKSKVSAVFKQEARKMFNFARYTRGCATPKSEDVPKIEDLLTAFRVPDCIESNRAVRLSLRWVSRSV